MRRTRVAYVTEIDSGFHLDRRSIPQVRLETPLPQGIHDALGLIGKRAQKMNMFHLPFPIDQDAHRNAIEPAFGEYRINPLQDVFIPYIVLHALRGGPSAGATHETGLGR